MVAFDTRSSQFCSFNDIQHPRIQTSHAGEHFIAMKRVTDPLPLPVSAKLCAHTVYTSSDAGTSCGLQEMGTRQAGARDIRRRTWGFLQVFDRAKTYLEEL